MSVATNDPANPEENSDHYKSTGIPDLNSMSQDVAGELVEWNVAERASEPSFILEPEKGLTPDPDKLNDGDARDKYNIKQIDVDEKSTGPN